MQEDWTLIDVRQGMAATTQEEELASSGVLESGEQEQPAPDATSSNPRRATGVPGHVAGSDTEGRELADISMQPASYPSTQQRPAAAMTLEQQLSDKEAQVQRLSAQLQHYRSWVASVNARVQHMNPKAVQNAKRLYVGNLPVDITEEELRAFLNQLMQQTGAQVGPEPAVVQCHITQERNFAFAEFRSVEEASNAMGLDGVTLHDCCLKIRRPSNYDLATSLMLGPITPDPTMDTASLKLAKPVQEESPHKLFVGGLPCEWPESAVRMLLEPWGTIKAFNLVMDKATGNSKGYAFCEYEDPNITDKAIVGLNGQRAGTKTLTVKRAAEGARQASTAGTSTAAPGSTSGLAALASSTEEPAGPRFSATGGPFARKSGPSTTTTTTYIMTPPPMVLGGVGMPGSSRSHTSQPPFPTHLAATTSRGLAGDAAMPHLGAALQQHAMVQPYMVQPFPGGQPHPMHFAAGPPGAPIGSIMLNPAGMPPGHQAFASEQARSGSRGLGHMAPGSTGRGSGSGQAGTWGSHASGGK